MVVVTLVAQVRTHSHVQIDFIPYSWIIWRGIKFGCLVDRLTNRQIKVRQYYQVNHNNYYWTASVHACSAIVHHEAIWWVWSLGFNFSCTRVNGG